METTAPHIRVDRTRGFFKVNRTNFTDQTILDTEMETIFKRCWLYLGHDSEIAKPNAFLTRRVGRGEILFTRDGEGKVHAFSNACPHRGGPVCREKSGTARSFQCFYHGWVFGSDGAMRYLPNENEYPAGFAQSPDARLKAVPRLDQYAGFWFICFDPDAVPLETYLAGAAPYLDRVASYSGTTMEVVRGTHEYTVRANWKLLMENTTDTYHGAPTHMSYVEHLGEVQKQAAAAGIVDAEEKVVLVNAMTSADLGNGHTVNETHAGFGRPIGKWHPSFGLEGKEEIDRVYEELVERVGPEVAERMAHWNFNLLVFPNMAIVDVHTTNIRSIHPVSTGEMLVRNTTVAPANETPALRKLRLLNAMEFLGPGGFGSPDDVAALEACQRGYQSGNGHEWNDISGGMAGGITDGGELCLRVYWERWNELVSKSSQDDDG